MLKFQVYQDGQLVTDYPLCHAYLTNAEHSAIRGDIYFRQGIIHCEKREPGPAALALEQDVGDCGQVTLQTCLLPDRDEPYLLSLELIRHRLMTLYSKFEDWAMFDLDPEHPAMRRFEAARRLFIRALCKERESPPTASRLAQHALTTAVDGSEELALAHAELLLKRRKATGSLPKTPIGCGVAIEHASERVRAGLLANFDLLYLPVTWRSLVPIEGDYQWSQLDVWAQWISRQRVPVVAGPVINFEPHFVPDWLFIWEHDYDTVRDLVYEHTQKLVTRYRNVVSAWNVVSGLHINNHFSFSFEQLMDLTRMTTMLVKKIQPAAKAMVEIRHPFGEYCGTTNRSIPPRMYADLLIQRTVNFDGFVVKLQMGRSVPGYVTRDLMQISHLLDQFIGYDKPVNLVVAVPSGPAAGRPNRADADPASDYTGGGYWRRPWSMRVQSRWLEAVFNIALSKPFVESVAWMGLMDQADAPFPHAGLIGEDMQPKPALKRLIAYRHQLLDLQPNGKSSASQTPGST